MGMATKTKNKIKKKVVATMSRRTPEPVAEVEPPVNPRAAPLEELLTGMYLLDGSFELPRKSPPPLIAKWEESDGDVVAFVLALVDECFVAHRELSELLRPSGDGPVAPFRNDAIRVRAEEQGKLRMEYQTARHRLTHARNRIFDAFEEPGTGRMIIKTLNVPSAETD